MKLGITSNIYLNKYGLRDGAKKMKAHGYEYIDYQPLANTTSDFFTQEENLFHSALKEQRNVIESEGIYAWQAHGPWCWPPPSCSTVSEQKQCVEDAKKGIRGTATLGAKNFIVHPLMPFGWQMIGDEHVNEFFDINYDYIRQIVVEGANYGVNVCLENMPMPDLPLGSVQQVLDFVKKVNHPNLKICLDTGHTLIYDFQPGDAVRLIGKDLLSALHVHDNNGQRDQHLDPGQGIGKWKDFASALYEINFEGVFSLETHEPQGDTPEEREQAELAFVNMIKNIVNG